MLGRARRATTTTATTIKGLSFQENCVSKKENDINSGESNDRKSLQTNNAMKDQGNAMIGRASRKKLIRRARSTQ